MKIKVYTRQECSACEKWKIIIRKICDEQSLEYIIEDITENQEIIDQLKFIGIKGVPVTFIDNYICEGCYSEKFIRNKIEEVKNG
jgi:glutaredoxin